MSEYPEMFRQSEVMARKPHRCESCCQEIPKGQQYKLSKGMWEGKFDSVRQHFHCADLMTFVLEDYYSPDPLCFQEVYEAAESMEILERWRPKAAP